MRCILHIGTEKTATTLLQTWIHGNRSALSAQGVATAQYDRSAGDRLLVSYFQHELDQYLKRKQVYTWADWERFFQRFEEQFAGWVEKECEAHSHFLLTSEHFHSRLKSIEQISSLKKFLDRFFSDFRIVCYFREQSEVRRSLYSSALRIDRDCDIEDFQANISTKSHYYNYFDFFRKWEDVFGMDALRPRLFARSRFVGGDIRKDFLATAFPDISADGLGFAGVSANGSLSHHQGQLFRAINRVRGPFAGRFPDPTPAAFKSVIMNLRFMDLKTPIRDPRQAEMYEAFDESNRAFFARYFGRSENLFDPPEVSPGDTRNPARYDIDDLSILLSGLLDTPGLAVLQPDEANALRNLADRLLADGRISESEATILLKLTQRAYPKGPP